MSAEEAVIDTITTGMNPLFDNSCPGDCVEIGAEYWTTECYPGEPDQDGFTAMIYLPHSAFWGSDPLAGATKHSETWWLGSFCEWEVPNLGPVVQINFTVAFYLGDREGFDADPHMGVSDEHTVWHVVDKNGNLLATLEPYTEFSEDEPPQVWALLYKLTYKPSRGNEWAEDGPAYLVRVFKAEESGGSVITVYKLVFMDALKASEDWSDAHFVHISGWPFLDYCFTDAAVSWGREVVWDAQVPGVDMDVESDLFGRYDLDDLLDVSCMY